MLRALARSGIRPELVVGTSVGAINGAFFASDPTVAGVDRLADIWRAIRRRHIYPAPPSAWVPALFGRRAHLCSPHGLRAVLDGAFGALTFDALPVRCAVVTADFGTSEEVVLQDGPVKTAVLASAAIPVIFPPVALDGRLLVDGALSRNTPISTAIRLGATRIIVLPTGFACGARAVPHGAVATALHHISVLLARQLANETLALHQTRPDIRLHVVPPLCPMPVSSYDFSSIAELIGQAERATEAWVAADGLDIAAIPMTLAPHTHESGMATESTR